MVEGLESAIFPFLINFHNFLVNNNLKLFYFKRSYIDKDFRKKIIFDTIWATKNKYFLPSFLLLTLNIYRIFVLFLIYVFCAQCFCPISHPYALLI